MTIGSSTAILASGTDVKGTLQLPVINHGTISAPGGFIDLNTDTITNDGLIVSSSGGRVQVGLLHLPTLVDNAGGTLRAEDDSTLTYSGQIAGVATLRAGILDGSPTGTHINQSRTTLDGATDGPIALSDTVFLTSGNTRTTLVGNLILDNGVFRLHDTNNGLGSIDASLTASGQASITGQGTLDFSHFGFGPYDNKVEGIDGSAQLTLGPGIDAIADTTNDSATFSVNTVNQGHIHASNGGRIRFANVTATNPGVIEASSTGVVDISRTHSVITVENSGGTLRASTGATMFLADRISSIPSTTIVRGGTLDGDGTFQNNAFTTLDSLPTDPITLRNAVFLTPGNTRTTLVGSLILDNGTFRLHDTNNGLGSIDATLAVSGQASITGQGTLDFSHFGFGPYDNKVEGIDSSAQLTLGPGIDAIADATNDSATFSVDTVNQGHIHASNGGRITLSNLSVNSGRITASGGATIDIARANASLTVNNTGGLVKTDDTYTFRFANNTNAGVIVVGGTLEGPGEFRNSRATVFDGASAPLLLRNATITADVNTDTSFKGTIQLDNGVLYPRQTRTGLGITAPSFFADGAVLITGQGTLTVGVADGNGFHNHTFAGRNAGSWNLGHEVQLHISAGHIGTISSPMPEEFHGLAPGCFLGTIEFPEIKNVALQDSPARDPAIFNNTPVVVFLAIFTAFLAAQKHVIVTSLLDGLAQ